MKMAKYKYTVEFEEVYINRLVVESDEPMDRTEIIDAACANNEEGELEFKEILQDHGFSVQDSQGKEV